jgi:histone arginine demethylase JMJD6
LEYFYHVLPLIKAREGKENLKYIECIQHPGETIFVPGGWWHAVVNLEDTMAVTQNFMSTENFDAVWKSFRFSRKKLSEFFLKTLKRKNRALYDRAISSNQTDKFRMPSEKPAPSDENFFDEGSTTTLQSDSKSSTSTSSSSSYSVQSSSSSHRTRSKPRDRSNKPKKSSGSSDQGKKRYR